MLPPPVTRPARPPRVLRGRCPRCRVSFPWSARLCAPVFCPHCGDALTCTLTWSPETAGLPLEDDRCPASTS